jgi:hypothetical protein
MYVCFSTSQKQDLGAERISNVHGAALEVQCGQSYQITLAR